MKFIDWVSIAACVILLIFVGKWTADDIRMARQPKQVQSSKVKTQLERFMTVTVDIEGRKHTFIFVDDKIFEHPRSCKGCNVGLPYVEVSR